MEPTPIQHDRGQGGEPGEGDATDGYAQSLMD